MHVYLEFIGVPRLTTGIKTVPLDLEAGTTFQDIVRILSTKYPKLIGNVIQPDGETLQAPHVFSLNGKRMVQEDQMNDSPSDGDRIILMGILAGG